jgi:hypothetical protein
MFVDSDELYLIIYIYIYIYISMNINILHTGSLVQTSCLLIMHSRKN